MLIKQNECTLPPSNSSTKFTICNKGIGVTIENVKPSPPHKPKTLEPVTKLEVDPETEEDKKAKKLLRRSLKKKEREVAEERRRSRSRKKYPPLSAECFLVSRGWQLDQTRLLR